ncbi:hypothetical protein [Mesorhizobium sp. M1272]|uniref:hypothetical protein n=1 Tax=Mesorhizobium sp. M1272 TaxID=2957074 RepID=UPI00333A0806
MQHEDPPPSVPTTLAPLRNPEFRSIWMAIKQADIYQQPSGGLRIKDIFDHYFVRHSSTFYAKYSITWRTTACVRTGALSCFDEEVLKVM